MSGRTINPNETEKSLGISMNRFYIPPVVESPAKNTAWENLPKDKPKDMKNPCLFQSHSISPDASRLLFEILEKIFKDPNTEYDTWLLGYHLEMLMYTPFEWMDNV